MGYCTLADLEARFGAGEMGDFDPDAVERAVADAGAEIDAFVGVRYTLPLAVVPPLLERLACDLTRYRLYAAQPTEEVRRRYEDALGLLREVARGGADLGVALAARDQVFGAATLGRIPS